MSWAVTSRDVSARAICGARRRPPPARRASQQCVQSGVAAMQIASAGAPGQ